MPKAELDALKALGETFPNPPVEPDPPSPPVLGLLFSDEDRKEDRLEYERQMADFKKARAKHKRAMAKFYEQLRGRDEIQAAQILRFAELENLGLEIASDVLSDTQGDV